MRESALVMLVDDSPTDGDFVQAALARSGFQVTLARFRKGEDALEFLGRQGEGAEMPSLMILDWKMPGTSGRETLEAVRQRYGSGDLPVVVFTSSREPKDIVSAYRAGANSYVVKPVTFEDFTEAVVALARYWLTVHLPSSSDEDSHG